MTETEREIRAARNQSIFRAVNEQIRAVNDAFAAITDEFAIACECADATCVETLRIRPDEYAAIRGNPRRFAVLPGHVDFEVEVVVSEANAYVVVEKIGRGAELAQELDPRG